MPAPSSWTTSRSNQARLLLALLLATGERIDQEAIARFTRGWKR